MRADDLFEIGIRIVQVFILVVLALLILAGGLFVHKVIFCGLIPIVGLTLMIIADW